MAGLSREVIRWLQSLDLTWQVKTPKWDLTNGFLVAEIFSWYFPLEITMHSYNNGTSLDSKQRNWALLKNFIKKHKLEIPEDFVEGTIHCKEGAAQLLCDRIYEILTNRPVKKMASEFEVDFTDSAYQIRIPMHARSTASQAIKNNLRVTEILADKNIITNQMKAQDIINDHIEHRRVERMENPDRFNIRPTLGELSERIPSQNPPTYENESTMISTARSPTKGGSPMHQAAATPQYQEIHVQQLGYDNAVKPMVIQH
ncbi:spermatogenesis-associated protein 4-like [Tubulanus polymorphus]|uniref:spermatogenesis-associated protein 4-like n=1 Tax=Tubulanus polymorphus TaxID=672921 RepID=UPI003DA53E06